MKKVQIETIKDIFRKKLISRCHLAGYNVAGYFIASSAKPIPLFRIYNG